MNKRMNNRFSLKELAAMKKRAIFAAQQLNLNTDLRLKSAYVDLAIALHDVESCEQMKQEIDVDECRKILAECCATVANGETYGTEPATVAEIMLRIGAPGKYQFAGLGSSTTTPSHEVRGSFELCWINSDDNDNMQHLMVVNYTDSDELAILPASLDTLESYWRNHSMQFTWLHYSNDQRTEATC